jgi:hypothetical protein
VGASSVPSGPATLVAAAPTRRVCTRVLQGKTQFDDDFSLIERVFD